MDETGFRRIVESLKARGAENINLVGPTPFWSQIQRIVEGLQGEDREGDVNHGMSVVIKTSGYEDALVASQMARSASIVVPDFKVGTRQASLEADLPEDYPSVAQEALRSVMDQLGRPQYDDNGKLQRGIVVRHLMRAGDEGNSYAVLERLAEVGFDQWINFMTRFWNPLERTMQIPVKRDVTRLAILARQLGMKVLIDGHIDEQPVGPNWGENIDELARRTLPVGT